jgi:hypothetical protein
MISTEQAVQQNTAAFGGTVLVDNPDQMTEKKKSGTAVQPATEAKSDEANTAALKLSIN